VSIINTAYHAQDSKIRPLNLKKVVKFTLSFSNKYNVEFNLRDILRWVDVTLKLKCNILDHLPLIFTDRSPNLKSLENEVPIVKLYQFTAYYLYIFWSEIF